VNDQATHTASCFCGAVELSASGTPEVMGYCHCGSCREWGAAPVNAFTLWRHDKVQILKGADKVGSYGKTPSVQRKWCTVCGGHLLTDIHQLKLVDVYAVILPTLRFIPSVHVHYQEAVLPMRDGLPKQKDFPTELGGSGILLSE
jgi:hypothetical protein